MAEQLRSASFALGTRETDQSKGSELADEAHFWNFWSALLTRDRHGQFH